MRKKRNQWTARTQKEEELRSEEHEDKSRQQGEMSQNDRQKKIENKKVEKENIENEAEDGEDESVKRREDLEETCVGCGKATGKDKGDGGNNPPHPPSSLQTEEDEAFTCEIDTQRLWQTCWDKKKGKTFSAVR